LEKIVQKFGAGRLITMAVIGLGLMAFFSYIMMRANQPEMGLIFSQIDQTDASRIIDRLQTMGVPNEVKGDGTSIYVPSDQIPRLRMELAQDGMPSGGVGYEIFDKQDVLGTTNALLNINQIRALEGELAKSIRTIGSIQGARVHLVVPKRELFTENKQEPSASVVVRMRGSLSLSAMQVQAIRYLVASAVPGLLLDQVSIVDDRGNLLARGKDSNEQKDSLTVHQDAQQQYEERLARSLEAMLDRTLGLNKSRVEVTAEMDFDQLSTTSVQYDPEGQVVRSQTTNEEGVNSHENTGSGNDGVSIQNVLPSGQENQTAGVQSRNQTSNTEENTNFEISNTTKNYVKELGAIKRLSIAVMIDGSYQKKDDGTQEYKPRTEEEINKLKEIVKTAVGYKEDRGDAISVINLKFTELPQDNIPEDGPKPFFGLNLNKLIELGITALVVLIGLFTVIRPIVSNLFKPRNLVKEKLAEQLLASISTQQANVVANPTSSSPASQNVVVPPQPVVQIAPMPEQKNAEQGAQSPKLPAMAPVKRRTAGGLEFEESMINVDQIEGLVQQSSIKKIGELVERHPEEAVAIIRTWMHMD
jgi:flagellar M-ring protein FliF